MNDLISREQLLQILAEEITETRAKQTNYVGKTYDSADFNELLHDRMVVKELTARREVLKLIASIVKEMEPVAPTAGGVENV